MASIINSTDTGGGGLITTGDSSDELQLQTAETARVTLTNTAVVVNEGGNDVDFRVESDTIENAFFLDGATGNIGVGVVPSALFNSVTNKLSVASTSFNLVDFVRYSGNEFGPNLYLAKSRGGSVGTNTIVQSGDSLGNISFYGANGTGFDQAASISGQVDGTPGASGDMPGRLVFSTSADGSATPTERARITSDGYLRMASGSGGIQFGGDTAAANALDDYEEGTWTPVLTASTTNPTYTLSVNQSFYTVIGRVCIFQTWIRANISNAGTGAARISLPFASVVNRNCAVTVAHQSISSSDIENGYIASNVTWVNLLLEDSVTDATFKTGAACDVMISGSYTIA